jgi:hypothetical protein
MSALTFRRYTTLPFLLDLLCEKRLALLDPSSWEDKNDSYYLDVFKAKKKLKSLLAICFAYAPETYHHWKIYSGNSSGVCIEFNRENLLAKAITGDGFTSKSIDYKTISELRSKPIGIKDLPFVKRYAFKDEQEFRIIYESCEEEIKIKHISIQSEDIDRIIVNPWIDRSVYKSIKSILTGIDGFKNVRVIKSTVVENDVWKTMGVRAIKPKRKFA